MGISLPRGTRDAGIAASTRRRYLEHLKWSCQAFVLPPYHKNLTRAVIKTPKLFLSDIGILRHRQGRWGAADRLIRAYDLTARVLHSEIQLAAAPNMLAELAGTASVYLLASREKSGQPLWILDARLAPAVFFVPAGE